MFIKILPENSAAPVMIDKSTPCHDAEAGPDVKARCRQSYSIQCRIHATHLVWLQSRCGRRSCNADAEPLDIIGLAKRLRTGQTLSCGVIGRAAAARCHAQARLEGPHGALPTTLRRCCCCCGCVWQRVSVQDSQIRGRRAPALGLRRGTAVGAAARTRRRLVVLMRCSCVAVHMIRAHNGAVIAFTGA